MNHSFVENQPLRLMALEELDAFYILFLEWDQHVIVIKDWKSVHAFQVGSAQFSSVQSLSHVRLFATPWIAARQAPCPLPIPGVHLNSRPSSWWCHPAISSSVVPFSSCSQSLPASESFPMSHLFAWGGQSTGVSGLVSFLPKNTQDWSPLEWTGWISLQSGGIAPCKF